MKRPHVSQQWTMVSRRPRWGCLIVAAFFALLATGALILLLWLLRPSRALDPAVLVGSDVDGLALVELSRASRRVDRLVRVLMRQLAYEVQSHPEDMANEVSQMLDVMTYREAIGLLRFDPESRREQWTWVVALKRMGSPLKVLVRQLAQREHTEGIETVTSGGVLLFWGKESELAFAISRGAFAVANDRHRLQNVLDRATAPPGDARVTPRANRLVAGLPAGGKHCVVRACVLATPQRWDRWTSETQEENLATRMFARLCRILDTLEVRPPALESFALAATVEPRGQLRVDLTATCRETSRTLAVARQLRERWSDFARILSEPHLTAVEPTTTTTGLHFGWRTAPVGELLAPPPAGEPPAAID